MSAKLTARSRLPTSLNGLRSFEAVARLGRVGLAARELNVTHGAVSRQIRLLEEALGAPLFDGPKHDQALTPAGVALSHRLTEAFEIIESAVGQIAGGAAPLRVACHSSITAKWLIRRMGGFTSAHPEYLFSLLDLGAEEIMSEEATASVRIVTGDVGLPLTVVPFASNETGLVCSPEMATRVTRDGLARVPRLVSQTRVRAFEEWSALSGLSGPQGETLGFSHLHFMIDAAVAGLGVAVAPWMLVADDVTAGRLVAPAGFVATPGVFALVYPRGRRSPGLKAFEAWLVEEGRRTPPPPSGRSAS